MILHTFHSYLWGSIFLGLLSSLGRYGKFAHAVIEQPQDPENLSQFVIPVELMYPEVQSQLSTLPSKSLVPI